MDLRTKKEMAQGLALREKVWWEIGDAFEGKIDLGVAKDIFKLRPL
jgi:hypothetical protein